MIDYIFFDAGLRDRFIAFATQRGIPCNAVEDSMGLVVELPEELEDALLDELEDAYDALQREQAGLSAQTEGGLKQIAGFRFTLPAGQERLLPLPTDLANRLLQNLSLEELQYVFGEVARCTLQPSDEPLCQTLAAQAKGQSEPN